MRNHGIPYPEQQQSSGGASGLNYQFHWSDYGSQKSGSLAMPAAMRRTSSRVSYTAERISRALCNAKALMWINGLLWSSITVE
jgi:hypothetical protein